RIALVDSISGVVHQGPVERLRMLQGSSGVVEFVPQLFFIQHTANGRGYVSQMFLGDVLETSLFAKFGQRLHSKTRGQQNKGKLLCNAMKELYRFRPLAARAGELNEKD